MIMRVFSVLFLFLIALGAHAQDTDWMKLVFGEAAYAQMEANAPQKIAFYAYLDANGHNTEDVSPKPVEGYPDALEVEALSEDAPELTLDLIMSDNFHPQLYDFDRKMEKTTWYRVGESSILITFFPMRSIKHKFDQQQ